MSICHCGKVYTFRQTLNSHRKGCNIYTNLFQQPNDESGRIVCSQCRMEFKTMEAFCSHKKKSHKDSECNIDNLQFSSYREFEAWKTFVENEGNFEFVKRYGATIENDFKKDYFYCHGTGSFYSKSKSTAAPKSLISNKEDFTCTCFAIVLTNKHSNVVSVATCLHHADNDKCGAKTRIVKLIRWEIIKLLTQQRDVDSILKEIGYKFGDQLERAHLLTQQDVLNVQKTLNLSSNKKYDHSAVSTWTCEQGKLLLNCVQCAEEFLNVENFAEHLLNEHYCYCCLADFATQRAFELHRLFKHNGDMPKCSSQMIEQLASVISSFLSANLSSETFENQDVFKHFISKVWTTFLENTLLSKNSAQNSIDQIAVLQMDLGIQAVESNASDLLSSSSAIASNNSDCIDSAIWELKSEISDDTVVESKRQKITKNNDNINVSNLYPLMLKSDMCNRVTNCLLQEERNLSCEIPVNIDFNTIAPNAGNHLKYDLPVEIVLDQRAKIAVDGSHFFNPELHLNSLKMEMADSVTDLSLILSGSNNEKEKFSTLGVAQPIHCHSNAEISEKISTTSENHLKRKNSDVCTESSQQPEKCRCEKNFTFSVCETCLRPMSLVRGHFTYFTSFSKCNYCNTQIYTNYQINLEMHLKRKHLDVYKQFSISRETNRIQDHFSVCTEVSKCNYCDFQTDENNPTNLMRHLKLKHLGMEPLSDVLLLISRSEKRKRYAESPEDPIHTYYTSNGETNKRKCNYCNAVMCKNPTTLENHLKIKHSSVYAEFLSVSKRSLDEYCPETNKSPRSSVLLKKKGSSKKSFSLSVKEIRPKSDIDVQKSAPLPTVLPQNVFILY